MKGVLYSVLASALFAVLYYYAVLLAPLDGEQIFSWRVIMGLPGLALILGWNHGWRRLGELWRRIRRETILLAVMPLSAGILGLQLWLFMWAPLHGKAMEVSLGYFLLPLTMVLVGRLFLKERLSPLQVAAVVFAAIGVLHELWASAAFSWATAIVCVLYPPYFLLRRWFHIDALPGLFMDMLLITPVAIAILLWKGHTGTMLLEFPRLFALIPLLGILSTTALFLYLSANRLLPMGLFGLLGYVEPVLLFFVVIFLLQEPFAMAQWLTYGPVWIAVGLLAAEGALALASNRNRAREQGSGPAGRERT